MKLLYILGRLFIGTPCRGECRGHGPPAGSGSSMLLDWPPQLQWPGSSRKAEGKSWQLLFSSFS